MPHSRLIRCFPPSLAALRSQRMQQPLSIHRLIALKFPAINSSCVKTGIQEGGTRAPLAWRASGFAN